MALKFKVLIWFLVYGQLFGLTIFLSYTLEIDFPTKDFSYNSIRVYPNTYKDLQLDSQQDFDYNYYYDNYELDLDASPLQSQQDIYQNYYDDNGPVSRGIPMAHVECREELKLVNVGEIYGEMYYPSTYLEILCYEMSSATEGDNRRVDRICKRQGCRPHYKSLQLFQKKHTQNGSCWESAKRVNVSVGCGCGSES